MMEAEGVDMSGFTYDDLPDAPELVEPRRRSKKNKRKSKEPKKRDTKKQKQEKVISLKSYSEASDKGNSKPSSGIVTSIQVDTIPSPPTSQQTTPLPTTT